MPVVPWENESVQEIWRELVANFKQEELDIFQLFTVQKWPIKHVMRFHTRLNMMGIVLINQKVRSCLRDIASKYDLSEEDVIESRREFTFRR